MGTYTSQWQGSDTSSWGGCCAQCSDNCDGWTYVYNGAYAGAPGQCWLKTGVGDPSTWDFDHKNSRKYTSQWQGSDTASWGGCCAQCTGICDGWTYVYNGEFEGALGQCWLKTGVGDPSTWDYDQNVISGLHA